MNDKNLGQLGGWWEVLFKVRQISGVVMVPLIIALVSVVVVPWCRGIEVRLIDLQRSDHSTENRVVALEQLNSKDERFTASMAATMKLELQNEWLREIAAIRKQIDTLPQTLQMPPVWWEQYVKSEIRRLEQRLDSHETKDFK